MTRILCKPSDFMFQSYAWCFKDSEKIDFWKCENFSQSPPTPCMWWNCVSQLHNSLWCLTTSCEEVLQRYSLEGKIRQICTIKFSSPQIVFEFAKVCVCVCVCVFFRGRFTPFLGLPGPRGGRKRILREKWWPVQGPALKSVPWGPVSWPFFVLDPKFIRH